MSQLQAVQTQDNEPTTCGGLVVVGVSPTSGSPEALRWAIAQARCTGSQVRAVSAWSVLRSPTAPGGKPPLYALPTEAELQEQALQQLATAVGLAVGDGQKIETRVVHGSVTDVLLGEAEDAQLLVLGLRHGGGPASAILRPSLPAPQLVARSPCPVVMVPPTYEAR